MACRKIAAPITFAYLPLTVKSPFCMLINFVVDPLVIRAIEIVAILTAAFSGFGEAQKKGMDLVGLYVVAFITAFGGGTLRDILLDRRPLFWVEHQEYALLVFGLSFIAFPLMRFFKAIVSERALIFADALGLGLFSGYATRLYGFYKHYDGRDYGCFWRCFARYHLQ
jgi:Glycine transporter